MLDSTIRRFTRMAALCDTRWYAEGSETSTAGYRKKLLRADEAWSLPKGATPIFKTASAILQKEEYRWARR
jgi:hypothetical protein